MSIPLKASALLVAIAFSIASYAQTPDIKPERIRGEIVSFDGDLLKVHRNSGNTATIEVRSNVQISALRTATLSDAKVGSYVGTAALTQPDGKLVATSLLIFPEAARGTAEGHLPYDFGPNSTMTNANVASVVTGSSGRELHLSYKGGSSTVTVPENVPVVTPVPASRTDLQAGKKVFVSAVPDSNGIYEAGVVIVEKNGVTPKF